MMLRAGKSAFKKEFTPRAVAMSCFSCIHRALSPFEPLDEARRCSLGDPRQGHLSQRSHRRGVRALCFLHGGAADLVFFLLLLEGRNLVGVGALLPSLGFKDFYHAARLQSPIGGHL
jgi:hypothetical protein